MKTLKFNTSHGDFALMDGKEQIDQTLKALLDEYTPVAKVSDMSEEQFAEVVDKLEWSDGYFMYYRYDKSLHSFSETWTAKESFESLVKSLGWYLFENTNDKQCGTIEWQEAESKTFFSPILLKKI